MIYKKRKLICCFALAFWLYANGSIAAEKLTGAFGKKFGEYFNPIWAINVIDEDEVDSLYVFKQRKPFRSFTSYYVTITPKTHIIYAISAATKIDSKSQCFSETDYIEELLKKKYLKPGKKTTARPVVNGYHLIQGKRSVVVKCSFENFISLHIIYMDDVLSKQADREQAEIEAESRGDSGP